MVFDGRWIVTVLLTGCFTALVLPGCAPRAVDSTGNPPAGLDGVPVDLDALDPDEYHPERFLVGLGRVPSARLPLGSDTLEPVNEWPGIDVALYEVPAGVQVLDAIRELRGYPELEFVEPDYRRYVRWVPNDPYYAYQWHFDNIHVEAAWDVSTGDGALVALLDTGLSQAGEDTPATISDLSRDFYNSQPSVANGGDFPDDGNGHGTHVAGTIAQATDNGIGVAGMAFGAELVIAKVLGDDGTGWVSDTVDAIYYVADQGVDSINMSLGSTSYASTEHAACDYAWDNGAVLFGAGGNDGRRRVEYPAGYGSVIGVAATDLVNVQAYYSNRGSHIEIAAPGGDVWEDLNEDGIDDGVIQETFDTGTFWEHLDGSDPDSDWAYYSFQGTSMACPHAAAVAALLASLGATNSEVRTILRDTAVDLGAAGWDQIYGWGLIDAEAAVAAYVPNELPVPDLGGPYAALAGESITFDGTDSYDPDGSVVSYEWDFVDGATATGPTVMHAYSAAGSWIVLLTVTDDEGASDTDYAFVDVDAVPNTPPEAVADGPWEGRVGVDVSFDGSLSSDPDGVVLTWQWAFGDDQSTTGITATHAYDAPGEYSVSLRVVDDLGGSAVVVHTATIVP